MFNEKSEQLHRLLMIADSLLVVASMLLSFLLYRAFLPGEEVGFFQHASLLPLYLAFILFFLEYFGGYRNPRGVSRFDYGWTVVRAVVMSLFLMLTLIFVLKMTYVSRGILFLFSGLVLVSLTAARLVAVWYFRQALKRGDKRLRVLIVGTGERSLNLARSLLENSEWGLDIIGHIDPDPDRVGTSVGHAEVIGSVDDIHAVLKDNVVDEVIIAIPRSLLGDVEGIARACEEEGVKLRFMADVFDLRVARMRLVELGNIPLLTLEPVAQDEGKLMVKRAFDLLVSALALPFLLPLFAAVAVAIKLDDGGPVFFVQERVGQNKRRFPLIKFRTMVVNAEEKMREIEHLNEAEGPIFKIENDPRITRVGRFLRKTSIDEFPQFLNVLRGDMSLIGPRPMSVRDVELFDKGVQRKRFSVKPGLACLREVSGRSKLSFQQWLELDLYYIDHWSLALDLKIFFKLIPEVFKGSGAV